MTRFAPGFLAATLASSVVSFALVGRASAPAGRYTIANGAVYDTKTKLTWQQVVAASAGNWASAKSYCSGLTLNGATWRLPTVGELSSIVDYSVAAPGPTVDATAFPGTPSTWFWSATSSVASAGSVWAVFFANGGTSNLDPATSSNTRCVH